MKSLLQPHCHFRIARSFTTLGPNASSKISSRVSRGTATRGYFAPCLSLVLRFPSEEVLRHRLNKHTIVSITSIALAWSLTTRLIARHAIYDRDTNPNLGSSSNVNSSPITKDWITFFSTHSSSFPCSEDYLFSLETKARGRSGIINPPGLDLVVKKSSEEFATGYKDDMSINCMYLALSVNTSMPFKAPTSTPFMLGDEARL